jgi:Chlorophyll A-B binding protein
MSAQLCLLALVFSVAQAFLVPVQPSRAHLARSETSVDDLDSPKMNPNNPNLPELKGDFDWDEKFGGDDDWITENVPGKIVMNEIDLAAQVTQLNKLEEKWRKQRQIEEYEASRTVGWVPEAELLNGRFAMFFLATGLLTEYWTGVSMPGQVEELLRIGGFIGFD